LTHRARQIDRYSDRRSPHLSGRRWKALATAALAVSVLVAGCGYTRHDLFPQDVHTVSIRPFENKTFYKDVQFDLSESLIKQIELTTPYKAASGGADTVLEGEITDVRQQKLSRTSSGGLPQELEVKIVVNFQWKDQRTGQLLRQRRGFMAVGRYVPTSPVGESFQVGQHAAAQRLAEQIVATMRSDF